jgi:hypothetical protein
MCKKKQDKISIEECSISLQDQIRKSDWYTDNGFTKHMTGDKEMFITLEKERDGSVSFGNDNSTKFIGKDTMNIRRKDAMAENFLLAKNMKHNLLSVSKMHNQGHKILFD